MSHKYSNGRQYCTISRIIKIDIQLQFIRVLRHVSYWCWYQGKHQAMYIINDYCKWHDAYSFSIEANSLPWVKCLDKMLDYHIEYLVKLYSHLYAENSNYSNDWKNEENTRFIWHLDLVIINSCILGKYESKCDSKAISGRNAMVIIVRCRKIYDVLDARVRIWLGGIGNCSRSCLLWGGVWKKLPAVIFAVKSLYIISARSPRGIRPCLEWLFGCFLIQGFMCSKSDFPWTCLFMGRVAACVGNSVGTRGGRILIGLLGM
jgi:hypothetical protein